MRNRKTAAWIGAAILLAAMAGCGDSASALPEQSAEEKHLEQEKETNQNLPETEEKSGGAGKEESMGEEARAKEVHPEEPAGSGQKKTVHLIGSVKSVGDGSFVISQAFEEGEDALVQPAEGSSDEVRVEVSVSEATRYEVKTVKNRGVNGDADVERREGDFSDLAEGVSVDISGYEEGGCFWAETVSISLFV